MAGYSVALQEPVHTNMPHKNAHPSAAELRHRAERLALQQSQAAPWAEGDARRTLHELQVHQIELHLQNEALQQSEAQAQEALRDLAELNQSMEERIVQRTAELVAARDAAEAANRAKSVFLSNMSHELRTPMNGVMGMVELALLRATDPTQLDWLGKARSSAAHLLSVINDILDISKMEAEKFHIESVDFRLSTLLDSLKDLLAPQVIKQGLAFDVDISAELANQSLLGDAQRISQILLNLAGNAVKFTAQGSVKISARVEAELADGPMVRFEVKDSGIGISACDHKRLFKAFAQVDDSMVRNYGGTGLGLAICKHMVDRMGGQIGLESALGKGSTFWFTLPLKSASSDNQFDVSIAASSTALAAIATEFTGARLLLAEDDPINQEVTRAMLDGSGLLLDVASDGAAAVEMAQTHDYELILMDLQMPKLSGIDATRAIRHAPRGCRSHIIAFTASVFNEDRQRCVDAGMDDHLAKPLSSEVLYETLLKWLRHSASNSRQP